MVRKENYIMNNELKHYGVLGMKWGVRRYQNKDGSLTPAGKKKYQATSSDSAIHPDGKRHLGIDDKGNINLIRGKSTKEAKIKFAIKSLVTLSTLSLARYAQKHPSTIMRGMDSVDKIMKKFKKQNMESVAKSVSDSGIYSKKLGRMLSISEAIAAGLM